ncbi:glycosyltransferase family 2 protein [Streptomyces sp. NPDC005438]|uniref:glycosyltransferase family 2 protein n=1 Tax=Streptomyces sp. NPDC005438 TaxID=3156880 RepID=UPI0033A4E8C9
MVKLSVVVPFYNVRPYAAEALRSLRANARGDFEFLLVDDSSSDGTGELLARAEREIPGARHIRHPENRGLAAARNTGLNEARGEWISFLDGDDWLAADYYPHLVASAEEIGCAFLRTDHVRCEGPRRTVVRVPHGRRGVLDDPREAILPAHRSTSVDYPAAWAGVYHRRLLDQGLLHFSEELRTAEDRPWIWRLHRRADSFAVVGLLGVHYRRGVADSLTQVGDVRQLAYLRAFDQVVAETARDPDADRLLPKAVRTYCAVLHHHLRHQDRLGRRLARRHRELAREALRRLPTGPLEEALSGMDADRADRLRRLRGRHRRSRGHLATGPSAAVAR